MMMVNFQLQLILLSLTALSTRFITALGPMGTISNSVLYGSCALQARSLIPRCSNTDQAPPNVPMFALAAGYDFTCGLQFQSGKPLCWGLYSRYSQIPGIYSTISYSVISAGEYHVCAVRSDASGSIDCWDWNMSTVKLEPLNTSAPFKSVATGSEFACGLTVKDGQAVCWGATNSTKFGFSVPSNISFREFFAGGSAACGIREGSGETRCWGTCDGNEQGRCDPPSGVSLTSMAIGRGHACGLKLNNEATCWGGNPGGEISDVPQDIEFSSLVAGDFYVCGLAIEKAANIKCWGQGFNSNITLNGTNFAQAICRKEVCQTDQRELENQCPDKSHRACLFCSGTSCNQGNGKKLNVALVVTVPLVTIILAAVVTIVVYKRRRARQMLGLDYEDLKAWKAQAEHLQVIAFTETELKTATKNYSSDMLLGTGAFGDVYKGVLSSGHMTAIKITKEGATPEVFVGELKLLSRIHHTNLVNLIGYNIEYQALVFEYMANGSLYDVLFKRGSVKLDWYTRIKIAAQTARGLEYLHLYADPNIIHRDVKSANVLLDEKYNAHVSDFGLSLLGPAENLTHVTTATLVGTPGYLDPEYFQTMQLSAKSDVYSLGIVILELLTGRKACETDSSVVGVVAWASEKYEAAFDPCLGVTDDEVEVLMRTLKLALNCTNPVSKERPTMSLVAKLLDEMVIPLVRAGGTISPVSINVPAESDFTQKSSSMSFGMSSTISAR